MPISQEVERDISRLIGESSHERTVRASASVSGSDDAWRVRVRMETGGEISERSLSAPTCKALEKAVALVIAITIEPRAARSEEHTSELQSLMRTSYAVFCLKT